MQAAWEAHVLCQAANLTAQVTLLLLEPGKQLSGRGQISKWPKFLIFRWEGKGINYLLGIIKKTPSQELLLVCDFMYSFVASRVLKTTAQEEIYRVSLH